MKAINWIIMAVCILSCTILVFYSNHKQKKIVLETKSIIKENNNRTTSRLLKHIKYTGDFELIDSLIVVDSQGLTQTLESLSESKPCLVLKISDSNCSFCIESAINSLLDYRTNSLIDIPVIILTSGRTTSNSLLAIENSYKNKLNFFLVDEQSYENESINELNVPYFFIVHKGEFAGYLFIPDAYKPQLTSSYLQLVEKECWANK